MIGVYLDRELEESIFCDNHLEHINMKNKKGLEKNVDVMVIDGKMDYAESQIKFYCNIGIPVMILVEKNINVVMNSSKSKYKIRYLLKNDISGIRKELDCICNRLSKVDTVFVTDCSKVGMLKLDTIDSITYSSIERECNFNLEDGRVFAVKKKFSEIEQIQSYKDFIKIERGTIINLSKVESLNYKDKSITFRNGQTLYLNKKKLKELEEILFSKYNAVYL